MKQQLICFQGLGRSFYGRGGQGVVRAVRDISLDIVAGETLGVVGESGCGKSTLGRMAVGLLEPSAGDVFFKGLPLYEKKAHADYRAFRRGLAGTIQMIFQDPYSSLNPRMSIGESVAEPLICARAGGHGESSGKSRAAVREKVETMLRQVGLEAEAARRYPHEFSGGQRQRMAIARALVTSPDFVVCDEPTSSLDASVQSQVLNLLRDMQRELSLTYMFISHDLAVVRHMSDRVAVMYRGLLVELGGSEDVFASPFHPYTRLLLESVPGVRAGGGEPVDGGHPASSGPSSEPHSEPSSGLAGTASVSQADMREVLSLLGREGCPFAPRCPYVKASCRTALPELVGADRPASALCRDRAGCAEEGGSPERRADTEEYLRPGQHQGVSRLVRCRLYEGGGGAV